MDGVIEATGGAGGAGKETVIDDELTIIDFDNSAQNPLSKLAHPRPLCATHKFETQAGRAKHCDMCYCYVCDIKAADCKSWSKGAKHCNAHEGERKWVEMRASAIRARKETARLAALTATPSGASGGGAAAAASAMLTRPAQPHCKHCC